MTAMSEAWVVCDGPRCSERVKAHWSPRVEGVKADGWLVVGAESLWAAPSYYKHFCPSCAKSKGSPSHS